MNTILESFIYPIGPISALVAFWFWFWLVAKRRAAREVVPTAVDTVVDASEVFDPRRLPIARVVVSRSA